LDRKLINYLPEVLRNFREFEKTFETEAPEFEKLQKNLSNVLKDFFVQDATERGVLRWEKLLKIVPKVTDSLDDRKFKIITKIIKQLPYTHRRLNYLLEGFCGDEYSLQIEHDLYKITVRINLTVKNNFNDVQNLLETMVPANLIIDLSLMFNQHVTVSQFTHGELSEWTHNYIRNEVLS
jgi:hypothetical protein